MTIEIIKEFLPNERKSSKEKINHLFFL